MKRLTGKDVARAAGVSASAVSRAFTAENRLNKATRDHILKVAAEMGYRPNALARSLIKQESDLVAVVFGNTDGMYDKDFFNRLSTELQKRGKWALQIRSEEEENIAETLGKALMYPVAAAIVRAGTVDLQVIENSKQMHVPLIYTGLGPTVKGADCVWLNYKRGGQLGTEHLIKRGCKKIAYIGGIEGITADTGRREGYLEALQAAGLQPHSISQTRFDFESGMQSALKLLQSDNPPDGFYCVSDAAALGALNAAKSLLNLRVPEDVAVVGSDNMPMAAWPCFDLTAATNPIDEIVQNLMSTLEARLADPSQKEMSVVVEPQLVIRGSA
ncbi:transcriptional regulator, LacI family [Pseudovibrio sp. FO-BEG1]|uniref:Transcriptional regulator, LacI family n=2 Tax=Pseudovibrio TaxID=258255 RepID=A0A1I6Z6A8_9HYPH|nr:MULTISPECIES: LacI family DNA-binding transcriptional regulator [Pseudovibrio]AEV39009.1 transcriptional regulator, LacI family [Pseudovibrio sp. FO-BEG1]QUS55079.1 LacI family DNA-binding transcriptional regulator [Pseudovibrio brasiliensis]SFT58225.1 transcriptional regulator, LacI family [Pseudovibrio denitrificans]